MKKIIAIALTIISMSATAESKYLGQLGGSKYSQDSTSNPYGRYGSKYSADSINNPYGEYGSKYSNKSPNNPYAADAPKIVNQNGRTYLHSK